MQIVVIQSPANKPWRNRATYRTIESSLRARWQNVRTILASNETELEARLRACGTTDRTFVFNIAEYLNEKAKRGFIPSLLDSWGYPHLGSSAVAVLTGLDKGKTKEILNRKGVPTPPFFVAAPGDVEIRERAARIGYPLIVKPLREGGHAGIGADAIVRTPELLERAILRVALSYRQPALVEEFIDGEDMHEFSVGVVGGMSRIHLPIEIDWARMNLKTRILSFEAAQKNLERTRRVENWATAEALNDLADRTFDALGAFDYARVDIRAKGEQMFVLEINIMPGLGQHSFLSLAALELGFSHEDLIGLIALESMKRQGLRMTA